MTETDAKRLAEQMGAHCLGIRTRLLHRMISGCYERAARPLGVRASQLSLITAIAASGPVRASDLAAALEMDKSTMSRDVERLKARGWVEAEPEPDGRGQRLKLTARGRQLLQQYQPAWEKAQREAAELLGGEGVQALHRATPWFPPRL